MDVSSSMRTPFVLLMLSFIAILAFRGVGLATPPELPDQDEQPLRSVEVLRVDVPRATSVVVMEIPAQHAGISQVVWITTTDE